MADYPYPLFGTWKKIVRAEKHFEALHADVREFLDANPYGFTTYLDYERSTYLFVTNRVEEPSPDISVLLGDYVHNLRSALDHLTWQLALLKYRGTIPRKVWREIQYPIGHDMADFEAQAVLQHLLPEHVALLKGFQPQKRTPYNNLALLRTLSNTDKHRLLHATVVTVSELSPDFIGNDDAEVREVWWARGKKLEVGAKLACVQFVRRGPDPKVDMEGLRVRLRFGDAPDESLRALRDITADIVNRCHNAFFPQ